jgi:DNA-binding LytR/AlgR family response regulator
MISCIIVEDQPPAQRILKKYIEEIGFLDLQGVFADGLAAIDFLKRKEIDLIFLDIHLPKLSGIDFLKIISPGTNVIFTTAFPDYALKGYELDIIDYLLKPFSFERFVKAVAKVEKTKQEKSAPTQGEGAVEKESSESFIFIKAGVDYHQIEVKAIQFIKSNGDYTQLFLENKKYLVSHSLKYWARKLKANHFCQIHKSYIVNVQHISKVSNNQIYINREVLPIGRTFKDAFYENYLEDL